jgi:inner membrane transporter RhtA
VIIPALRLGRLPPTLLVLAGVASVQFGAAFSKSLFDDVGPGGTVFLRVALAAVILAAIWRPSLRGHSRSDWKLVAAFGFVLAAMNLSFYAALDRIPLGIAVTLEFVGPLGVAVFSSRRGLDFFWIGLAAAGILLLSDFGTADLDGVGMLLALVAGALWASYILLAARVGRTLEGGDGLALAMIAGAVLLVPVGVADAGTDLVIPEVLAVGAAVAMLSSAIPYSLELEALRRMPQGVFGVLMSIEPAMAALVGYVVLDEALATRELVAIVLVVAASAGAARHSSVPPRDA